jgi:hypothetical protein
MLCNQVNIGLFEDTSLFKKEFESHPRLFCLYTNVDLIFAFRRTIGIQFSFRGQVTDKTPFKNVNGKWDIGRLACNKLLIFYNLVSLLVI